MFSRANTNGAARSLLALIIGIVGLGVIPATPADAVPTTCGGVVFQDYDADGERNEDYSYISTEYASVDDAGVEGLTVSVIDAQGDVFTDTTDSDGVWSIALDTNDFPIRVDVSGYPSNWTPGPVGPDSATLNQFITDAADCTGPFDGTGPVGNASIAAPGSFCENRPDFVTSCFLFGSIPTHDDEPSLVSLIDGAIDDGSTGGNFQVDTYTTLATLGEVGTVYGVDVRPQDGATYAASFVKRHTQLGPNGNPTTIYRVDASGPAVWYVVDAGAVDPHSGAVDGWLNDDDAFDDVGREGLGDLEISPDGNTLYTVDLGNRQLVTIPINADGSANTSGVTRTNITAAALGVSATCVADDVRPFGLGFTEDGELLVGAVCSAESTVVAGDYPVASPGFIGDKSELDAWVFTFSGGSFSNRIDVPLPTASRGQQSAASFTADWRPWVTQSPYQQTFSGYPNGAPTYAQPLLADIEADGDDLIIGFMDIWGHQAGPNAFLPNYDGGNSGNPYSISEPISSGDIVRAVGDGAGGYTFPTSGVDFFYTDDNYGTSHQETALGSSGQIPGRPYTVANTFDPVNPGNTWQSGGLEWFDNSGLGALTAGQHVRGYRLYDGNDGFYSNGSVSTTGTFEKAAGVGDLVATCGVASIQVGNLLWHDVDGDGIADPSETKLAGIEIELVNASGVVVDTTTTDVNGEYLFDNLVQGADYTIRVSAANYSSGGELATGGTYEGITMPTTPNVGSDDGIDSDATVVAGLPTIAFTATATDHTLDIGLIEPVRLGNTVWIDEDGNGSQNGTEPGVPGVEVQLWSVDGAGNPDTLLDTDTTDGSGRYLFTNIPAGDYIVAIDDAEQAAGQPLNGYVSTSGNGTAPDPDVNAADLDDNGDPATGFASIAAPVTLTVGGEPTGEAAELAGFPDANSNFTVDFGFVPQLRLGNLVWLDTNNNGVADSGEAPLIGVDVQLWTADAAGDPLALVATDTTDADGLYLFENLDPGSYVVAITDLEQGSGQPLVGLVTSTGNDVAGSAPDPDDGVNNDDNGTEAAGFAAITDAFTLDASAPTGETNGLTTATEEGGWADGRSDLTIDFGFIGSLRLGNTVWIDEDGNGSQNGTEPGIPGVEVQLWTVDGSGAPLAQIGTDTTDGSGRYSFENLRPGDYIVAIADTEQAAGQPLDGFASTTGNGVAPDADTNAADRDDNGDPAAGFASISLPVTLSDGGEPTGEDAEGGWVDADSNYTVDFGFVEGLRLGNQVFEDLDDDGIFNNADVAISGVDVQLWSVDGAGAPDTLLATDTTDGLGRYEFVDLAPGDYIVAIADGEQAAGGPLESLVSADGNGTAPDPDLVAPGTDLDDNGDPAPGFASIAAPVTLTSNNEPTGEVGESAGFADDDSNLTVDFGFERRYRVGNLVWFDADNDGVADSGEAPIPGVEVQLWTADAAGDPLALVTTQDTDANGQYLFEDLEAGSYVIAIADTQQATGQPLVGTTTSTGNDPAPDPDGGADNVDDGSAASGFAAISQAFTLDNTAPTGETDGLTGTLDEGGWVDSSSDLTVDFGFIGSLRLGNTVWLDEDANGSQNGSEPGVPGVEVQLWSVDGGGNPDTLLATDTTDGSGRYSFENLVAGDYIVAIADTEQAAGQPLEGRSSTTGNGVAPDADTNPADRDDNGDPAAGFASISLPVTLTDGGEPTGEDAEGGWVDADSNYTVDFGFTESLRLGNLVFEDLDDDGIFNNADVVIVGVDVQLWSVDGAGAPDTLLGTDTTDASGFYLFENLAPGDYIVAIADGEQAAGGPLENLVSADGNGTAPDVDANPLDSDDNGDAVAGFASITDVITLLSNNEPTGEVDEFAGYADNDSNLTVDLGFERRYRVGNLVWFDADNDGVADGGEAPIPGVEVQLWTADAAGDPVTQIATDTTDANGQYLFEDLEAGDYVIAISDGEQAATEPLDGFVSSTGNDVAGSAPDPDDGSDNVDDGDPLAGFASISDAFTLDNTAPTGETDGLAGGLDEGGWVDTSSDLTVDFGFTGPLRLGNTVWLDEDGNGSQNGSEPGIPGVEVQLWSVDGAGNPDTLLATDTTDGSGRYLFENLVADDYIVAIADTEQAAGQPLEGRASTTGNGVAPDPDTNPADLDDNGDAAAGFASISAPVTLAQGSEPSGEDAEGGWVDADSNLTVDFGFTESLRLGNLVFEDLDDDGIFNNADLPIPGVEVQLWTADAAGNPVTQVATDTTDGAGLYLFENLAPGSYVIAIADTEQAAGGPLSSLVSADGNGTAPDVDVDPLDSDDNGDPAPGFASITDAFVLSSNNEPTGEVDESGGFADDDSNLTVDLGFERRYRLGNLVWNDLDGDGVVDADEAPIAGVEVQLWTADAAGDPVTQIATDTTDSAGRYLFEDLEAGDYVVAIADTQSSAGGPLDGMTTSVGNDPAPDPDDGADNDDNGSQTAGFAAISAAVTLDNAAPTGETDGLAGGADEDGTYVDSSSDLTVDFGFVGVLSLGDTVFSDDDGNGSQNGTESGIPGVEVQLWSVDAAGNPVAQIGTDVTDANGNYSFTNLPAGDYIVAIADTQQADGEALDGLASTSGNGVAPDPDDDVEDDDNGDPAIGFASISAPVTLSSGTEPGGPGLTSNDNPTVDFGFLPSLELGNLVWFDVDNDGVRDAGEAAAPGVTVQLVDASGAVIDSAITDADGHYLFTNVAPGTYTVRIPASQFVAGGPLAGWHTSTGAGSSADANDDADDNNDGSSTGPARTNGVTSGPVTLVANTEPTSEVDESPTGAADASSNLTVDFGFYQVSLGDEVWFDDDNDGIRDPNERPAGGVTLVLLDELGNPVLGPDGEPMTQVTDADGGYQFTGLPEGTYIVQVPASNFVEGGPLAGVVTSTGNNVDGSAPDPDNDVNADDNGNFIVNGGAQSQPITITAGDEPGVVSNPTVDFGFTPAAGLGNRVWFDNDRDGVQDPGEPGVPGVTVVVRDVDSGQIVATVVTDANGEWQVTGLPPGRYTVTFSDPQNRPWTVSNSAEDDSTDSDVSATGTTGVTVLEAGELDLTIDAGITSRTSTIAFTGSNLTSGLIAGAFTLLLLGGGFVLLARRRDNEATTA